MTADFDFDNEPPNDEVAAEEEAPARAANPLRLILLIVLVVVIVCCLGGLALRTIGGNIVSNLPIPGIGAPEEAEAPTTVPDTATPVPPAAATEEALVPVETVEVTPGPVESPTPGVEETVVIVAPTEETVEPIPETVEPAEETVEPTEEMAEAAPEATTTPTAMVVAGPTPTPAPGAAATAGPTVVVTVENCQNNAPPTAQANGPYTAMMGKGEAFVTFEAKGSTDADGTIVKYEWDFGDGSTPGTGQTVTHGYTSIGSYTATLTVTDNCGATGQSIAQVTIAGPTPPGTDEDGSSSNAGNTASPAADSSSTSATIGFCYRVQPGDTLSGIAQDYSLLLSDLAVANGVSTNYFVIAGQGLFIPSSGVRAGSPNVYQVQTGDTLASVASQCGLSVTTLAAANNIANDDSLTPGQFIIIPAWE